MLKFLVVSVCLVASVLGHGRLIEPPSRNAAWRFGFKTPTNTNDMGLYCGGLQVQIKNGGKCGVCGDSYSGPRPHEAGGKYATGTIVRSYKNGQSISIVVDLTAAHKGWFEFRLCPNNNPKKAVTQACLDKNLLKRSDGGGARTMVTSTGKYNLKYDLPNGLTCSQCVLQWRYHAGNSWGVGPDGKGCSGCGYQEEFVNCADIAIGGAGGSTQTKTAKPVVAKVTSKPSIGGGNSVNPVGGGSKLRCQGVGAWKGNSAVDVWCSSNCPKGTCPKTMCVCA